MKSLRSAYQVDSDEDDEEETIELRVSVSRQDQIKGVLGIGGKFAKFRRMSSSTSMAIESDRDEDMTNTSKHYVVDLNSPDTTYTERSRSSVSLPDVKLSMDY